MFGLTRREQRWKAEQQATELLVSLASVAIKARAEIDVAEANAKAVADAKELEELRAENLRLKAAIEEKNPVHTDHPMRHYDRTCRACVKEE